jgi:hypothetical protein
LLPWRHFQGTQRWAKYWKNAKRKPTANLGASDFWAFFTESFASNLCMQREVSPDSPFWSDIACANPLRLAQQVRQGIRDPAALHRSPDELTLDSLA